MFKGEFREKNQQEVPVNVDGIDAEHFEAFLQCLYPSGREPKGKNRLQNGRNNRPMFRRIPRLDGDARGLLQREAGAREMPRTACGRADRFRSGQVSRRSQGPLDGARGK